MQKEVFKKLDELVDNFPSTQKNLRVEDIITGEKRDTALGASVKLLIESVIKVHCRACDSCINSGELNFEECTKNGICKCHV